MALQIQATWNDFAILIGLDHGCVHCILRLPVARPRRDSYCRSRLKHWVPYLDREACFVSIRVAATHLYVLVEILEIVLVEAGLDGCTCSNIRFKYQPSAAALRRLRNHRRHATGSETCRVLSFQIKCTAPFHSNHKDYHATG